MKGITKECRNDLLNVLAKELDTRDKRFMFLKIQFPSLVSIINLEGSAKNTAWAIYEGFEKQQMLGSLMASLNTSFDAEIEFKLL